MPYRWRASRNEPTDEDRQTYLDLYAPGLEAEREHAPSAAVVPHSVEQVQAIVDNWLPAAKANSKPTADDQAADEFVSDPAKPVPYIPRPVRFGDRLGWQKWLVNDQRGYTDRPDVLTYVTAPLTAPLRIAGVPIVQPVAVVPAA